MGGQLLGGRLRLSDRGPHGERVLNRLQKLTRPPDVELRDRRVGEVIADPAELVYETPRFRSDYPERLCERETNVEHETHDLSRRTARKRVADPGVNDALERCKAPDGQL